jgi:hypothetical protein
MSLPPAAASRGDDFGDRMHGVWMILQHPNVHRFDESQQREVIEYVYTTRQPLAQRQDHLYIQTVGGNPGKSETLTSDTCLERTPG